MSQKSGHSTRRKFLFIAIFTLFINGGDGLTDLMTNNAVSHHSSNDNHISAANLTHARLWQSESQSPTTDADDGHRQGKFFHRTDSRLLFGARRRITFALLPIMYKLGVISTLLVGLTVMVLKGLTIGVILLFFALGNSLLKYKHHQPQPVHFHLHPGDLHSKPPIYHGYEPSGPWDKASEVAEESYENYDPSHRHRTISYKYPYRYHSRDPYYYHGR